MLRKIIVLFLIFFLMPALVLSSESPDEINKQKFASVQAKIKSIDVATLKSWIDSKKKFILLDVREPDEINAIKIAAENNIEIPRGVVEFYFPSKVPDLEATVVVYCSHGKRSAVVTDIINGYGYKNIYSLKDGIYAWIKAGYQVENFYGTFEMQNFKTKI
ncbi:MAG: rhodanese-like domain-containing protein [Thermodesulfovibrionales bacterium]|nr:rhodanese-like domain-containing protein [Thermodesulfovibrionales bacterium]